MSMSLYGINILAVVVSAFVTFMIGGLWYGMVFARKWVAVHGFTDDQVAAMQKKQGRNFGIFIVGDLIMAVVLSLLLIWIGVETAVGGAGLGALLWVGISATTGAAKNAAYDKTVPAFLIDTLHELVCLVAMGGILGAWR